MKKTKYFLLLSAFLLCLTAWPSMTFASGEVYDPTKKGSITVSLDQLGTVREGVTLYCYPVGAPTFQNGNLTGWEAENRYSSLKLDLNDLEATQKHRNAAKKLVDFIEKNDIQPLLRDVTDRNGVCTFEDLEQGMYLICQKDGFSTYGTVQDFLMPVPYLEASVILYDVKTETKGTLPVREDIPHPSDYPEVEPTISPIPFDPKTERTAVKTGDTTPTGAFVLTAAAALGCAGCLWALRKKRKQDA